MLDKNTVQNHQISYDLEVNSNTMVSKMTYSNVIIIYDNLYHIVDQNLETLKNFKK